MFGYTFSKVYYILNLIFLGFGFDALTIKFSNFLLIKDIPFPIVGIDDILPIPHIPIPKPFPDKADGIPSASCNPPKVDPNKNDP